MHEELSDQSVCLRKAQVAETGTKEMTMELVLVTFTVKYFGKIGN